MTAMRAEMRRGAAWAMSPVAIFTGLRDAWRRHRVYRRTLRELRALSRRELEERGIGPEMITRLAVEAAYGAARTGRNAAKTKD
jgi:uncharacterized protein YjiS (DUF1127 family)